MSNAATNILSFSAASGVDLGSQQIGETTVTTSGYVTVSGQNYCQSCNTWYYGQPYVHVCTWYYPPPPPPINEVAELKAWLDGYTADRQLTKKQLAYIRRKLRNFLDE